MKTLNDFVDGYESVLAVVKRRYGHGYAAYVANEDFIGEISSALTGGDTDAMNIQYGIFRTDWYPVGFGGTIEEAIIDLNIRVSAFISDEGLAKIYFSAYNSINCSLFRYDPEKQHYVFNKIFSEYNFPQWLEKLSTITEDKLETL